METREGFRPLGPFDTHAPEEMVARAEDFYARMDRRRTVRDFSPQPVDRRVIAACLRAAGTAPSGAHRQPWRFVAISDPDAKRQIRQAAEAEEQAFYGGRAPEAWLQALEPLGTDAHKPFLETAPWLIAIFAERHGETEGGERQKNYYVAESVGIATGMLITALHHAGLATLTHTPSPMGFLSELCGGGDATAVPSRFKPYLLLVVGHPAPGCQVPDLTRKPLEEITSWR
ncbi:MAG: nitroreductase family protein [Myxococcota bacterium]|jgi:nitroreductase|nr:nitroreductase family protein [Myxococcota bacterium]